MNNNKKNNIGYIFISLTMFIYAINPIVFKYLTGETTVNMQNFLRSATAALTLFIYSLFIKPNQQTESVKEKKLHFKHYLIPGFLYYISAQFVLNGISLSKANLSAFIMAGLGPVILIIFVSLLIKEERNYLKNKIIQFALLFGFIGTVLILIKFTGNEPISVDKGALIVLTGTTIWSFYIAFTRKFYSNVSIIIYLRNVLTVNTLLFFVTIIITKEIYLFKQFNIFLALGIMFSGFLADGAANILFLKGIDLISAVKANVFLLFAPVLSIIFAKLFLNENMTVIQIIGSGIVLSANIFLLYFEIVRKKE